MWGPHLLEFIAPALAVTCVAPSQQSPAAYTMAAVTTGVKLDITSLVNPKFSITSVEDSASQVAGSFLHWTCLLRPCTTKQIIAEKATQNTAVFPIAHLAQTRIAPEWVSERFCEQFFDVPV